MPDRIQRRRTAGWRAPAGAKYVGRGTRWGNPYRIEADERGSHVFIIDGPEKLYAAQCVTPERAREVAASRYRVWLKRQPHLTAEAQRTLCRLDLMCWCPLPAEGKPDHCHAAVLLDLSNAPAASTDVDARSTR